MTEERMFAIIHGDKEPHISFARECYLKIDGFVDLNDIKYVVGLPLTDSRDWKCEMYPGNLGESDRLVVYQYYYLCGYPVVTWGTEKHFKFSQYNTYNFVYVDELPRYRLDQENKRFVKLKDGK